MLSESVAQAFDEQRGRLDKWWQCRSREEQDELIKLRHEKLPGTYQQIIGKAGFAFIADHRRDELGLFRLPPMLAVYLEIKARERNP